MSAIVTKYFINPFAVDGDVVAIPDDAQPDGSVSYDQGFPFDYQRNYPTDPAALPVPRTAFNQVLLDITQVLQQVQQQGAPNWIDSADNGGTPFSYGKGVVVIYTDGQYYRSTITANVNTPGDITGTWLLLPITSEAVAPVICDYASTTNLTLSGVQNIDGGTGAAGQVIGCFGQTTAANSGVYIMQAGAWTRSPFYNVAANMIPGSIVPVRAGTLNGGTYFQLATAGPIVVGTTALTFSAAITSIANNSVNNAKLAQMAASTIKANLTGGTANPTDATIAAVIALANALTSFAAGAGTVSAADSVFTALQKIVGNVAALPFTKSFTSADQAITYGTAVSLAHGLGVVPKVVTTYMVNQTTEAGYNPGDIILVNPYEDGTLGLAVYSDSTNTTFRFSSAGFPYVNKTTGASTNLTAANWKMRVIDYA